MNSIFTNVLIVFHVAVCLLLCLVVLMQRPKQEGLGAAFGGGMTDQAFGARTTDVLQKGTVFLGTLLFVITLSLAVLVGAKSKSSGVDKEVAADKEEQLEDNKDLVPPINPEGEAAPAETPAEGETPAPAETPAEGETPAPAPAETPAPAEGASTSPAEQQGATIGAAQGGIIGHQSGRKLEGAAIGAAVGGITGQATGGDQPQEEEAPEQP